MFQIANDTFINLSLVRRVTQRSAREGNVVVNIKYSNGDEEIYEVTEDTALNLETTREIVPAPDGYEVLHFTSAEEIFYSKPVIAFSIQSGGETVNADILPITVDGCHRLDSMTGLKLPNGHILYLDQFHEDVGDVIRLVSDS